MNNKYAYIYNWKKAQYFIREGHDLVEEPKNGTRGDIYYKFKKDEKLLKTTEKYKKTMDFIEKIKK